MKSLIKISIVFGLFIAVISTAYYFFLFLPSQKKSILVFEKQTECKNICETIYNSDKRSLGDTSVFNPIYSYNSHRNSCFYSGGWLDAKTKTSTRRIINCQSNEEVLTFMTINNEVFSSFCDTCVNSIDEYRSRESELMGKVKDVR